MSGGAALKKRIITRVFRTDDKLHPGEAFLRVDLYHNIPARKSWGTNNFTIFVQ